MRDKCEYYVYLDHVIYSFHPFSERGARLFLPGVAVRNRSRHPVLLGGEDGHDGDAAHGKTALQRGEINILTHLPIAEIAVDLLLLKKD